MAERTLQRVRSRFTYDAASMRYRDPSGRFVPADRVRRALLDVVRGSKRTINALARELAGGKISVGDWQAAMETAVKDLNLAATMAAKGGPGTMTPRDFGLAGARIRFHYERIDVFARLVEDGRLSAGQITARAQLYANAGAGVYENARREAARGVMTEERRVLGNAEHCPVCVEEAAKGWQAIGTLKRLGDSPCRANCKCRFRFRA
jgi:hypothetical protein